MESIRGWCGPLTFGVHGCTRSPCRESTPVVLPALLFDCGLFGQISGLSTLVVSESDNKRRSLDKLLFPQTYLAIDINGNQGDNHRVTIPIAGFPIAFRER